MKVDATTTVPNGKLHAPRRLDIACGQNKTPGFVGIDIAGDADIVWDLFTFPWPIRTGAVREIVCSHFVEHIPHHRPGWDRDGWWLVFGEIHRIARAGARCRFVHPFARSERADWDPTHERRIEITTWNYLNRAWREANRLDHYPTTVDFDVIVISPLGMPPEVAGRADAALAFAISHYVNAISDLDVTLEVRK